MPDHSSPSEIELDRPLSLTIPYGAVVGAAGFETWSEVVGTVFDVDIDRTAIGDFRFGFEGWNLGQVVLGACHSHGHGFRRDATTIARSGVDHFLVQLYTEGNYVGAAGGHEIEVRAGDICVFDLSRPASTATSDFANINLVVPRSALAPLLASPEAMHGLVLRGDTPRGSMLSGQMRELHRQMPRLGGDEAKLLIDATFHLAAACLGPSADGRAAARRAIETTTLGAVKAHIARRLGDPDLGPDRICRDLGLSRSALYRLFDPLGGVADYIRRKRMARCWEELSSPRGRGSRVSEIAYRWGFTNEASFSRAFRQAFGVSPSELRAASEARLRRRVALGVPNGADGNDLGGWIRDLMLV